MGSCGVSARNKPTLMGPAELSAGAKRERYRSCLGRERGVEYLGVYSIPFLRRQESLLGNAGSKPRRSSPARWGSGGGETRARADLLSLLTDSSRSSSSLGLTGVPGLGCKKIYKTLLNQQ